MLYHHCTLGTEEGVRIEKRERRDGYQVVFKGDETESGSYRGVTPLNTIGKGVPRTPEGQKN